MKPYLPAIDIGTSGPGKHPRAKRQRRRHEHLLLLLPARSGIDSQPPCCSGRIQSKADSTGQPIRAVSGGQATGIGCALAAGVDCGAFSGFEEACARYVRLEPVCEPDSANRAVYDALDEEYLVLYQCLKTRMEG